ncbi:MAG: hypothetical protein KF706_03370 [Chitinophagales bacterium]|nr:hypothetical protein [Chitinophagales bacterium]
MPIFLRKLIGSAFFFPTVIFAVCVWRIFVPQLPSNSGLGWDGYRYFTLVSEGLQSSTLDSYLVLRIFPLLLIHIAFKLFGIAFAPASVILAFKIMNTILITCSAWMVRKIFEHYKLSLTSQLIGMVIVFLNYAVLNFTFYYPVMTDTPAFFLSVALFYFFVRGELLNIALVGLMGAFTFPVLLPMALALILFPNKNIEFVPLKKTSLFVLGCVCCAYVLIMGYYLIFVKQEKVDLLYALPLSYGMLPVSFFSIALLYYFMPMVLGNKTFLSSGYFRSQLSANRLVLVAFVLVAFALVRAAIPVNSTSEYTTLYHQIKVPLFYAFQRPMITVVNHFNYFGSIMLLLILFWKKFAVFISRFGLGIAASVLFVFLVFFMKPESRALIFFFPWLMILISLFLGQYKFGSAFYFLILLINFATAKLWLFFEYDDYSRKLLPDGTIDFPNQWFFMNLGIWETEYVWLWLCFAAITCLAFLFLCLYRIRFYKKEILFYKKYSTISL